MMSCSTAFLLFLALCKLFTSCFSGTIPMYDSFLQCLSTVSTNPIPKDQVSSILYAPANASFSSVLQAYARNRRFNTGSSPKPVIIVTPLHESHVPPVVTCAKKLGVEIRIRSGGHDYEGISYVSDVNFIILDMFNLRSVDVDVAGETAWVQAGATLGELYYRIWEKSSVHGFPGGVCPTVGVGGHVSGGGYGNMIRRFGLTVDHVVDARIVDVKGRILDRKSMGEDLFWAINGGGGASFGVILAFKIKLLRVPKTVTYFRAEKYFGLTPNFNDVVSQYFNTASKIDNNLFIRLLLQIVPPPPPNNNSKTVRSSYVGLFLGDSENLISTLNHDFPTLGLKKQDCFEMSWIESLLRWGNFGNGAKPEALLNRTPAGDVSFLKRKSDYLQTPIPKQILDSLWNKMLELGNTGLAVNPYGGKMAEIPSTQTPFPHRAGILFKIQYAVSWTQEGEAADRDHISQIRALHSFLTPFVSSNPRQAYLNYRDLDIGTTDHGLHSYEEGKVYGHKYFMGNYERLVKVKSMVDPENFFRNEQSIPSLSGSRNRNRTGSESCEPGFCRNIHRRL
nr:reticuline oxidase-like protein [Ipomoea batatas]